ncbi:hypothetical protein GCM10022225_16760 [Plantactinospora mayteni]|uniref:Uncharacterized protein n=1 Tax=Plantactinospora mayteni TaxID=566021 RepID=A0ABQ4EG94_9ACTN|nr:hypothetical protein Pma05_03230 [Plantactinospora mayteni]
MTVGEQRVLAQRVRAGPPPVRRRALLVRVAGPHPRSSLRHRYRPAPGLGGVSRVGRPDGLPIRTGRDTAHPGTDQPWRLFHCGLARLTTTTRPRRRTTTEPGFCFNARSELRTFMTAPLRLVSGGFSAVSAEHNAGHGVRIPRRVSADRPSRPGGTW